MSSNNRKLRKLNPDSTDPSECAALPNYINDSNFPTISDSNINSTSHNANSSNPHDVHSNVKKGNQKTSQPNANWTVEDSPAPTKTRVSKACDHCRKRKIKCGTIDLVTNKCSNCIRYHSECTFYHQFRPVKRARPEHNVQPEIPFDTEPNYPVNSKFVYMIPSPDNIKDYPTNMKIPQVIFGDREQDDIHGFRNAYNSSLRSSSLNNNLEKSNYSGSMNTNPFSNEISVAQISNNMSNTAHSPHEVVERMETIDKGISSIIDRLAKFEWILDKLAKKASINQHMPQDNVKPIKKQYETKLLTTQKLEWFKSKIAKEEPDITFLAPITNILNISLKWYITETKKMIAFSIPSVSNEQLPSSALPKSKAEAESLLQGFTIVLATEYSSMLSYEDCLELCNRYYDNTAAKLIYPEMLFLNIIMCIGANVLRNATTEDLLFLNSDRIHFSAKQLKDIEAELFTDSISYYKTLTMASYGTTTITGLLLLFHYIFSNYNAELALNPLTLAIKYAIDLGLNKNCYYNLLGTVECLRDRGIWWQCFHYDKLMSLENGNPPMIKENDMDIISDQSYFTTIKYYLLPQFYKKNPNEIDKITTLDEGLSAIINYSEHLPFFISFYHLKLVLLESKLNSICFSLRNMIDFSFDEIIQNVIGLRGELNAWKEKLHPSMKLGSYKQYISLLFAQSKVENPALSFDVACRKVIKCHLQFLNIQTTLNLFITSFLLDNMNLYKSSLEDIPSIFSSSCRQSKMDSVKICEIILDVPFRTYMSPEILHHFLTGAYVLIFDIIRNIDIPKEIDIPKMIDLLNEAHEHVVGDNFNSFTSDNMKLNLSLFFFTFLLKHVMKYFNENNKIIGVPEYNIERYDILLDDIVLNSQQVKNNAIKSVLYKWKVNKFHDLLGENINAQNPDLTSDISSSDLTKEDLDLFKPIGPALIKSLISDVPIVSCEEGSIDITNDPSLASAAMVSDTVAYSIYSHNAEDRHLEVPNVELIQNINSFEFCRYLPFGRLLFDRDFKFMKHFNEDDSSTNLF